MHDDIHETAAIVACLQLTSRFYMALDLADFQSVSGAFLPHGVWHRQGKLLTGPIEVMAALSHRPKGRTTAHLVQNAVVELQGGDSATVRYMTLVYRHDAESLPTLPVPLEAPLSISMNEDGLQRDPDGRWRILSKKSQRHFAT